MKLTKIEIGLIIAAAVLFAYAYSQGVFAGPEKGYQTSQGNVTDGSTPTVDDNTAKNRARAFRNAMLDNSVSTEIFKEGVNSLLSLSDADLIAVSNAYNKMFVNEEYNTLRSVLVQEWVIYTTTSALKKQLLERFTKIGI
jgi:hypothetical protein